MPGPHSGGKPRTTRDPAVIEAFNPIDDTQALEHLRQWAETPETVRAILVDNPPSFTVFLLYRTKP